MQLDCFRLNGLLCLSRTCSHRRIAVGNPLFVCILFGLRFTLPGMDSDIGPSACLYTWLGDRLRAVGYVNWPALARRTRLTRGQLEALQRTNDPGRIPHPQLQALARALRTTPTVLHRVSIGQRISPRHRNSQPASAPMEQSDWPPVSPPPVPCLGIARRDGTVELMPHDDILTPLPLSCEPNCFALRIDFYPLPSVHRLYRPIARDQLPADADVAVYLHCEAAHVGRLCEINAHDFTLQLPDNLRLTIPHADLLQIAREFATYPPPIGC